MTKPKKRAVAQPKVFGIPSLGDALEALKNLPKATKEQLKTLRIVITFEERDAGK